MSVTSVTTFLQQDTLHNSELATKFDQNTTIRKRKPQNNPDEMETVFEVFDKSDIPTASQEEFENNLQSNPIAQQYPSQTQSKTPDMSELYLGVHKLGNMYEMTIENGYGQIILFRAFRENQRHMMLERVKYYTDPVYREYKKAKWKATGNMAALSSAYPY